MKLDLLCMFSQTAGQCGDVSSDIETLELSVVWYVTETTREMTNTASLISLNQEVKQIDKDINNCPQSEERQRTGDCAVVKTILQLFRKTKVCLFFFLEHCLHKLNYLGLL